MTVAKEPKRPLRSPGGTPLASNLAMANATAPTIPVDPATSLRERKKARQRAELLVTTAELFRRHGYEQTRMEDIAARASVSTKTVYNYFPTKQRVLIELLDQDRVRLQAAYEDVLGAPPDDPAIGLARLIRADVGDVLTIEDKRLWRELLGAATRGHDRAEDEFDSNRRMFTRYIERLLQRYIQAGRLCSALPIAVATDMIYAVSAYDFREYCADEATTPEDLECRARGQMALLVSSWLPEKRRGAG
jgi:AcrR family transcriptional regulator